MVTFPVISNYQLPSYPRNYSLKPRADMIVHPFTSDLSRSDEKIILSQGCSIFKYVPGEDF